MKCPVCDKEARARIYILCQMCCVCAREMLTEACSTGPQRLAHRLFL